MTETTKLNPLIEAIGEIDEAMIEKAQTKAKKRVGLRVAIIAAAAALLLGTTAAATFGNNPIVKINNQKVKARYSNYVNAEGWTVETTAVELPVDYCSYKPVGEIRATYDSAEQHTEYYDELGVRLHDMPLWFKLFVLAQKEGETTFHGHSGFYDSEHHQRTTTSADGKMIEIEFWQDPAQALKNELYDKKLKKMTIDERLEEIRIYGDSFEYTGLDGYAWPSYRELLAIEDVKFSNAYAEIPLVPSEAMILFDYAPVELDGFSEKAGLSAFLYSDATRDENGMNFTVSAITQQMFVYTLVEEQSGAEVLFTVWRSAENKDTYTDHFNFDYEYIPLNNGTQARLHEGLDGIIILEFEKDGAAYGLNLGTECALVDTVLEKMELK